MVERVAQHRHCSNCEKAIPYKDRYCDEACEKEHKEKLKKKKRELTYFYAFMVLMFVLAMALLYLG